ncbi:MULTISPECIES: LuxR C-terminal-related transcriptional regulator [unclassified Ruegeria]|uniref:helix-turn-helix transcriptional regulator n=1 Tax=unclassified Ruegeria TaxID=2625375 RepID=UPI0014909D22|nr:MULTISPECIES: LuxR C-terminal-related transcriptional regulator [unclassified Ruegeria]NOD47614.1 hypothetical protein [Ruegeria sp. HKCCD5849]NOD52723.1 hypothetical protein [Ruegeria sp. HKCCD5851]NOD66142.1 hypothetical protein [Ruegeria sp. HKCCD7303]
MTRATLLWSLFAVQALCSVYFLLDIVLDFWPNSSFFLAESDLVELLVTVALIGGLAFTTIELRSMLNRQSKLEDQMKVASGAFGEVLEARFQSWSLTQAERDVGILAIKGFAIAEIAEIRDTKQGTIKAQCASIYRKAGVSGRLQLLSLFVDDLLADNLIATPTHQAREKDVS